MENPKLTGHIENGLLMLSKTQLRLRRNWLKNLKDGTEILEELSVRRKPKSWQQVKTHWGLVIQTILSEFESRGIDSSILLNLPIPTGIEVSKGMLQEYLYAACPEYDDNGTRITMSNRNWSTKNSSSFFENIRNFAASQWGIYIPEPNPEWRTVKE